MESKNLTDKSTSNSDKFKLIYTDEMFKPLYKDERFELLINEHGVLKDVIKEDLYLELIEDPLFNNIKMDGGEFEGGDLGLSEAIRDFYGVLRFGDVKSKMKTNGVNAYVLTCDDGEQCLLQEPTVRQVNELMKFVDIMTQYIDALEYGNYVVINCWLSGDDEIRKDEKLYFQIGRIATLMVETKIAHIKKN